MKKNLINFIQPAIDIFPEIAVGTVIIIFSGSWIFKMIFQQVTGYAFAIRRDNRNAFRDAQKTFRETFSEIRHHLEVGKVTLNVLILQDFPKHDIAFKNFLFYLRGKRKRLIYEKWQEYKNMYYILSSLESPFGLVTVMVPMETLLNPQKGDAQKHEDINRQKLITIIHDLLHIAHKKI